jgi:hypothetical protein
MNSPSILTAESASIAARWLKVQLRDGGVRRDELEARAKRDGILPSALALAAEELGATEFEDSVSKQPALGFGTKLLAGQTWDVIQPRSAATTAPRSPGPALASKPAGQPPTNSDLANRKEIHVSESLHDLSGQPLQIDSTAQIYARLRASRTAASAGTTTPITPPQASSARPRTAAEIFASRARDVARARAGLTGQH